jgi:hypothetical protein
VVVVEKEALVPSVRRFDTPDWVIEWPKLKMQAVEFGPYHALRLEFEPGWVWSEHARPEVKTDTCEYMHIFYVLSGHHHAKMNDGTDLDYGPGDFVVIPPGHDGWTVGDEQAVILDFGPLLPELNPKQ